MGDYGGAGFLQITGNYTQASTGWLLLELGNFAVSEYDLLFVTGIASLQGVIYVEQLASFSANENDVFTPLWFGARGPGTPAVYPPYVGPDFSLDSVFDGFSLGFVMRRV